MKSIKTKHSTLILIAALIMLVVNIACENEEKDSKPTIDMGFEEAFPKNCDTVYVGESFHFIARLSDNEELGSFSIDIHNNSNHHSHSTEENACSLDPIKESVNPFSYIKNIPLPAQLKSFVSNEAITVPDSVDTGDYHMYISVVDKTGWQTIKILSIKIYQK